MSNNNIIGERIKELREQAKEKQWELGEMIFSSQTAISHYENGRIEPNVDTIAAIAKHYNVSADYLLGLTDKKQKHLVIYAVMRRRQVRTESRVVCVLWKIRRNRE